MGVAVGRTVAMPGRCCSGRGQHVCWRPHNLPMFCFMLVLSVRARATMAAKATAAGAPAGSLRRGCRGAAAATIALERLQKTSVER